VDGPFPTRVAPSAAQSVGVGAPFPFSGRVTRAESSIRREREAFERPGSHRVRPSFPRFPVIRRCDPTAIH
jgi:hypothetical protein